MTADIGTHPRARFRERCGIELTLAQLREIEARLSAGGALLLMPRRDRANVHVAEPAR